MPPPNTPEEGLMAATATLALRPLVGGDDPIDDLDIRNLEYEGDIDENLLCPICRVPFVAPVITDCDHVFCKACITRAHATKPICPIDRQPLKLVSQTRTAPKIIHNQLDSLRVSCPNQVRGCERIVTRSLFKDHVALYCDRTLVSCPRPACDQTVVRKDVNKGCLHYDVKCEYCEKDIQKADLEHHQVVECPKRTMRCHLCGAECIRSKQKQHVNRCPEEPVPCDYAAVGCARQVKRRNLPEHTEACSFQVVGPVGRQLARLRGEVEALKAQDQHKERRIKFLEGLGYHLAAIASSDSEIDAGLPEPTPTRERQQEEPAPYESRDQYFLSLFETLDRKVDRLAEGVNELDIRQSTMLFNESAQVKDQITEVRSTLGAVGMHVRWLMNARLQERGRIVNGTNNMAGTGNTGDMARRLSDGSHPPRL